MSAFESARREANQLRAVLAGAGSAPAGYALARAACQRLDVALRRVPAAFPLLHGADATINVRSRWLLVRDDVAEELAAFLIAHEIGHLRLHPAGGTIEVRLDALTGERESQGVSVVEAYGAFERQELQANVFARELLLPRAEARRRFLEQRESASSIAVALGIPLELVRLQVYDAVLLPQVAGSRTWSLPDKPTDAQAPAVDADDAVTLVEAGPGTGKTTTLLLRLRRLLAAGARPESVLILTFSNKAARELVERARARNIAGAERVWIGTFHSFGLECLRKFHHLAGLNARFAVLDKIAALALLEALLPTLQLTAFDPLSNPHPWLENIFDSIKRAKDELIDAEHFAAADAKRRDTARVFQLYEQALGARGCVDFADLLCKPIALMKSRPAAVDAWLRTFQHVMVDEYQDVNRASALLVKEASRHASTLWVVGDANQAIYAFMGASSRNLEEFSQDFPGAKTLPLLLNHRSSKEIVDVFTHVARNNPAGRPVVELQAERGNAGHGPLRVISDGRDPQMAALAQKIRELRNSGVPLAGQAILTYRNSDAANIAEELEARGIPVLFLGNIFDRPEIKDLICLLQLAIDPAGVNLVRRWATASLRLTPEAADAIIEAARAKSCPWSQVRPPGLSTADEAAFGRLRQLCESIDETFRPWDALCIMLLEDGGLLRELAARDEQSAANSRMALWHFVHSCRTPDGTGRSASIRHLTRSIRDRIRMNERTLRETPPEAEGMDAVRIHTAHGSKGLEFDAVHLVEVTRKIFAPSGRESSGQDEAALRNERHNLLYVSMSRARQHLVTYHLRDEELPACLDGQLIEDSSIVPARTKSPVPIARATPDRRVVPLQAWLNFTKCSYRHQLALRTRDTVSDELRAFQIVERVTSRLLRSMLARERVFDDTIHEAIRLELQNFNLDEEALTTSMAQRVFDRLRHADRLLQDGGQRDTRHVLDLGPLDVELRPEQAFVDGEVTRLRLIRSRTARSMDGTMRQPLAALLDSHHRRGGIRYSIEFASLADGETQAIGTIKEATRTKFSDLAHRMAAGDFAPVPEKSRHCHFCPYLFPCSRRQPD